MNRNKNGVWTPFAIDGKTIYMEKESHQLESSNAPAEVSVKTEWKLPEGAGMILWPPLFLLVFWIPLVWWWFG